MPFAYVPAAADLLQDEHLAERGFFERASGGVVIPGPPFKMSETPLAASAAPVLGSANEEVLVKELGYEKGDLTILSGRGLI
jgi:crotonobetainyl-CoA:carnitine CoA-transferase CaiB-like acyl-CoA transferase